MHRFGTLLKYATFASTLGFVGAILLQIFARLFLETAPSWTEEAARVFFVWAIGCSAGLALRSGEYVHFDFLFQRLSAAWQSRLRTLIDVSTVALFAVFSFGAAQFTLMGWAERSPSLKFPMAIPFGAMLVLGASVLVYALWGLRQNLRRDARSGLRQNRRRASRARKFTG